MQIISTLWGEGHCQLKERCWGQEGLWALLAHGVEMAASLGACCAHSFWNQETQGFPREPCPLTWEMSAVVVSWCVHVSNSGPMCGNGKDFNSPPSFFHSGHFLGGCGDLLLLK